MLIYPELAIKFVNESGNVRTASSRRTYLGVFATLQSMYPGLEAHQFTTSQLTRWCLAGDAAPNTIKNRRSKLKSLFDWAAWQGIVKKNPASDLKFTVKPGHGAGRAGVWLTEEQVAAVLRACPDTYIGRRQRIVLLLGFSTGLRRFEIAALRWNMFSSDLSRLNITGKGRKLAQLGVPPQLRAELQAWRRLAPVGCQTVLPSVVGSRWGDHWSEYLWDQPLSEQGVLYDVAAAGDRVGITFRPHDMRRSFAGILEVKGVPIADISRMMRHENIGITSAYLDKNPNRAAKLADTFELAL